MNIRILLSECFLQKKCVDMADIEMAPISPFFLGVGLNEE